MSRLNMISVFHVGALRGMCQQPAYIVLKKKIHKIYLINTVYLLTTQPALRNENVSCSLIKFIKRMCVWVLEQTKLLIGLMKLTKFINIGLHRQVNSTYPYLRIKNTSHVSSNINDLDCLLFWCSANI